MHRGQVSSAILHQRQAEARAAARRATGQAIPTHASAHGNDAAWNQHDGYVGVGYACRGIAGRRRAANVEPNDVAESINTVIVVDAAIHGTDRRQELLFHRKDTSAWRVLRGAATAVYGAALAAISAEVSRSGRNDGDSASREQWRWLVPPAGRQRQRGRLDVPGWRRRSQSVEYDGATRRRNDVAFATAAAGGCFRTVTAGFQPTAAAATAAGNRPTNKPDGTSEVVDITQIAVVTAAAAGSAGDPQEQPSTHGKLYKTGL